MKTPIRYGGGKSKAIKIITPFVENYNKIISPFMGGGSLEVHWASMGKEVIVYKIVGLEYRRTFPYLHRDKTLNTSTLDELKQQSKDVQKIFVELVG